jgi:hypothetical protein
VNRRGFIAGLIGLSGVVMATKATQQRAQSDQVVLTHTESRSGVRKTDMRIVLVDDARTIERFSAAGVKDDIIARKLARNKAQARKDLG